jgi:hypothetical protein
VPSSPFDAQLANAFCRSARMVMTVISIPVFSFGMAPPAPGETAP